MNYQMGKQYFKINNIIAFITLFISFLIYLLTMAPTASFWDCGEFIATSYIMGVPHPPGSPLYLLLGNLFSQITTFSDIGARVNLMSPISSAFSVMFLYLITVYLIEEFRGITGSYKDAIINSSANDIVSTTKLSGVPVSVIKSENFQSENSWYMKKLLNSRFKHRARMLLNIYSSFRLKYHLKNKNSNNIKKSRQFYSAGKSVQTIKNIESATTIMRRLGQSLTVE